MTRPIVTDLEARFRAGVTGSAASHLELADLAAVAEHVRAHADRAAVGSSTATRHLGLQDALTAVGIEVAVADGDDPATVIADTPIGIVAGALGVAETGSVLVAEHALADRVVTMLCQRLVLLVDRTTLVAGLEEVAGWLSARPAGAAFASLITGPSRTADIERSLSIGVQGPQEVDVVVLG